MTDALASVRYCINIRGTRVKVTRYEGEEDYGEQVQRTFAKFAQRAVKDYRVGFRNWPDMNHVEERILDLVARLYPDVFGALDEFCVRHAPISMRRSACSTGRCSSTPRTWRSSRR